MEPLILQSEKCQLGAAALYRLAHRGATGRRRERESDEVVEEEKNEREKVTDRVKQK